MALEGREPGMSQSVTPRGGVWRKFSGEIFQGLDASADFVPGGGGFCCVEALRLRLHGIAIFKPIKCAIDLRHATVSL